MSADGVGVIVRVGTYYSSSFRRPNLRAPASAINPAGAASNVRDANSVETFPDVAGAAPQLPPAGADGVGGGAGV